MRRFPLLRLCFPIPRYYPVGVLFYVARHVTEVPDWDRFYTLGVFMAVVVLGYVLQHWYQKIFS